MSTEEMVYGYEDDSSPNMPALSAFLNQNVKVTEFEKDTDEESKPYLKVTFMAENGSTKTKRYYEITKTSRDNVEITDPQNPALKEDIKKQNACIMHIVSKFVPKDTLKAMPRVNSYIQYIDTLVSMLNQHGGDWKNVSCDLFSHYQWSIGKDTNRTWPEIPRNMKQGAWLCRHVDPVGQWHEIRREDASDNQDGLLYVDDEGNQHPLKRSGWFLRSAFAKQQVKEEDPYDVADSVEDNATGDDVEW